VGGNAPGRAGPKLRPLNKGWMNGLSASLSLVKNQWKIRGSGVAERQMWSELLFFSPILGAPLFWILTKIPFWSLPKCKDGMAPHLKVGDSPSLKAHHFSSRSTWGNSTWSSWIFAPALSSCVLWFLRRKPGGWKQLKATPIQSMMPILHPRQFSPENERNVWNPKSWTFWFRLLPL